MLEEHHNEAMQHTANEVEQVGPTIWTTSFEMLLVLFLVYDNKWSKKQNQRVWSNIHVTKGNF